MRPLKKLAAKLLDAIRAPAIIQETECHTRLGHSVQVRVEGLFTVVAVNNVRLLFHRLTGRFDGVIVEPADCHETHAHARAMQVERV